MSYWSGGNCPAFGVRRNLNNPGDVITAVFGNASEETGICMG